MTSFRIVALCAAAIVTAFVASPRPALAQASTPVIVTNPGDIAAAEGIQQPIAQTIACFSGGGSCEAQFSTPPNQRFILESVAITCNKPAHAQLTQPVLFFSNGRAGTAIPLPLNMADQSGFSAGGDSSPAVVVMSQLIKMYIPAKQDVGFQIRASDGVNCLGMIFGQAVNSPSG